MTTSIAKPFEYGMRSAGGQAQFCYATNYLIDVKNAVIVDVEATTAVRQAEVTAANRMIGASMTISAFGRAS